MFIEIIGVVATVILVISMFWSAQTKSGLIAMRLVNAIACILFVWYGVLITAYSIIISNAIILIIDIFYLYKAIKTTERRKSMAKFEHTQGLSVIEFDKTITVFCPLGDDYYTATIGVEFVPNEWVMDYLDVEDMFKNLQGSKLIIEDLTVAVFEHLNNNYAPAYLRVVTHAENATHFPVTVVKESD